MKSKIKTISFFAFGFLGIMLSACSGSKEITGYKRDKDGNVIVEYDDGTSQDLGKEDKDGKTITGYVADDSGYLYVKYNDGTKEKVSKVEYNNSYVNVRWVDWDGTLLDSRKVKKNTIPTYEGKNPSRRNDSKYSYTFTGWSPSSYPVEEDTTYVAQYSIEKKTFTVAWQNWDGTSLEIDYNVTFGDTPKYNGRTPTKANDANYLYTFSGWSPQISSVSEDIVYTAKFNAIRKDYTVTWKDNDGTILETKNAVNGVEPTFSNGNPPGKQDGVYCFKFDKWIKHADVSTGNIEYVASYTKSEMFEYDFTSDNTECYIIKYKGDVENLVIPEKINNVPVTTLKIGSFKNNENLKNVVFPESVISIESSVFSNCKSLESLKLPGNLLSIGNEAFNSCVSMKAIDLPESIQQMGCGLFKGCTKLDTLGLPFVGGTVTSNTFLAYLFGGSSYQKYDVVVPSLKKVIINEPCEKIYDNAFYNCSSIKEILILSNSVSFSENAFTGCFSLEKISFENNVKVIADNAFKNSTFLDYVILSDNTKTIGDYSFTNCSNLSKIVIPDSVESIGNYAFSGCTNLSTIVLGKNIKTIGSGAFSGCKSLAKIILPDSVTTIGRSTFSGCTSLSDFKFGSNIKVIPYYCFLGCKALEEIIIPTTVEAIEGEAFESCSALKEILLPRSIKTIGTDAFLNCESLERFNIPDTVKSVGMRVLGGCNNLKSLGLSGCCYSENGFRLIDLFRLSNNSYDNSPLPSSLSEITIEGGVVPSISFKDCVSLRNVNLNSEIKKIADMGFANCKNLVSLSLPNSITAIGSEAFKGCTSLETLTLPKELKSIGYNAFEECNLSYLSYELDSEIDFMEITGKSNINVPLKIINPTGEYAFRFDVDNSIDAIPEYCFSQCNGLDTISLPEGISSIGKYSFANCTSLDEISIPKEVSAIGDCAFYNCSKLRTVSLQNGIKTIGASAFRDCSSLKSLLIPSSVESIGSRALEGCKNLETLSVPFIGKTSANNGCLTDILEGNYIYDYSWFIKNLIITEGITNIPTRACSSYRIQTLKLPNTITKIGKQSFDSCSSLKSIKFGNNLTKIESYAFRNIAITELFLPDSTTTIEEGAFYGCDHLKTISIPDNISALGESVFEHCNSLENIYLPNKLKKIPKNMLKNCPLLEDISFDGTIEEWEKIIKGEDWHSGVPATVVYCTDGNVAI